MRAFHHHGSGLQANALDPFAHHDARQHRTNRAAPWFVLAALAFLAALITGCGGSESSTSDADASSSEAADSSDSGDSGASGDSGDTASATTAALENIFDSDLLVACDGVGFPAATAYDTTAGTISPVVVLAGEGTEMYGRTFGVREAWTRQWTQENPLALAEIQLVVCAEKQSATPVEECTGYEIDGVVTDNVVVLNEVTYAVSLREALTGAEVASETMVFRDESCPTYVSFTEGEPRIEWDSFDDLAIQDFVESYVVH